MSPVAISPQGSPDVDSGVSIVDKHSASFCEHLCVLCVLTRILSPEWEKVGRVLVG